MQKPLILIGKALINVNAITSVTPLTAAKLQRWYKEDCTYYGTLTDAQIKTMVNCKELDKIVAYHITTFYRGGQNVQNIIITPADYKKIRDNFAI